MLILNVLFVLIAIAMIALILMQRGAGAQAGSGFGSGASATVFGARGSSNFMSKATKWLAILFFGISLFMSWYANHQAASATPSTQDLGVMAGAAVPKAADKAPKVPTAPAQSIPVPVAPLPVPTAPVQQAPASQTPASQVPTQPPAPSKPAPQGG